MSNNRDNFSETVKRTLAERVGWICSFPNCGQHTVGPSHGTNTARVNNGVAAHITAASKGGPRYDESMSPEQRSSIENGIWMCRDHGNLIDTDYTRYTVSTIKQWKIDAEEAAHIRLSTPSQNLSNGYNQRDLKILSEYCQIFTYDYIMNLKNEPFRARVPNTVIDPLYKAMAYFNNPSYEFNDPKLELIRQDLNLSIIAFNRHFGQQSGGTPDYYDYIDLNKVRITNPERIEYWVKYIEDTQLLAYQVGEAASKLLNIHSKI